MNAALQWLARFALGVSQQAILIASLVVGLGIIVSNSEALLVLCLLGVYLLIGTVLSAIASAELALAVILAGVFVALIMQFTAADLRSRRSHGPVGRRYYALSALLGFFAMWVAFSVASRSRGLLLPQLIALWLGLAALEVLLTTRAPFKATVALLTLIGCSLLYYAGSTAEASLFVIGAMALASFAVALAASQLALWPGARGEQ
jgi:hypothetical protein